MTTSTTQTSIIDIGRRASALYKNMCTKEESIDSAHIGMLYARQAAHKGKDYRRQRAIRIAQRDHASIDYDCKNLIEEVTRHKDYPTAENHDINKKARRRVNWKGQMELINKAFSLLTTTINSNNIPNTDIDLSTLGSKLNTLRHLLPAVVTNKQETDHPTQPLNLDDTPRNNKTPKTDQLKGPRKAITGSAKHSMLDIEVDYDKEETGNHTESDPADGQTHGDPNSQAWTTNMSEPPDLKSRIRSLIKMTPAPPPPNRCQNHIQCST